MEKSVARQVIIGILMAAIFMLILFGSMVASIVETSQMASIIFTPDLSRTVDFMATLASVYPDFGTITATLTQVKNMQPTASIIPPTFTITSSPTIISICQPPPGWIQVVVYPGDTLRSLAHAYGTSVEKLIEVNCLIVETLIPGSSIYVPYRPFSPTPSATTYVCGSPPGWTTYRVQPGDTLYSLSLKFRTTVTQLQLANCLGSSTLIRVGDLLYVPDVPTSTYIPTFTQVPIWTSTPTFTLLPTFTSTTQPVQPSSSPTPTFTSLPDTSTPTPTPTSTQTATSTSTNTVSPPQSTPTPTATTSDGGGG